MGDSTHPPERDCALLLYGNTQLEKGCGFRPLKAASRYSLKSLGGSWEMKRRKKKAFSRYSAVESYSTCWCQWEWWGWVEIGEVFSNLNDSKIRVAHWCCMLACFRGIYPVMQRSCRSRSWFSPSVPRSIGTPQSSGGRIQVLGGLGVCCNPAAYAVISDSDWK